MICEFCDKVSAEQSTQIKEWLIKEQNDNNCGFYCNWNIIKKSIGTNNVYCLSVENEIVAFLVWDNYDLSIKVNIVEVKPSKRCGGIGTLLVEKSLKKFKELGYMVVDLECNPPLSELFWRKLGFRDFPNSDLFSYGATRLFKSLYQTIESSTSNLGDEVIEIWSKEPHEIKDDSPDWVWVLNYKDKKGNLAVPIIHPCKSDWKIRWRKGHEIYIENKAKRFLKSNKLHGDFIIIESLVL